MPRSIKHERTKTKSFLKKPNRLGWGSAARLCFLNDDWLPSPRALTPLYLYLVPTYLIHNYLPASPLLPHHLSGCQEGKGKEQGGRRKEA